MVLNFLMGMAALALVGSFLGGLHGVGDSLAVFRLGFAALVVMLSFAIRARKSLRLLLFVTGSAALASVLWHKLPLVSPGPIAVYQKNMYFENTDINGLAQDILAANPDLVTLQEVSIENEALLNILKQDYPHQHLCRYTHRSGIAVLSRFAPAGEGFCGRGLGLAVLPVATPDGPVWAVALHLSWPFPWVQLQQIDRLGAVFATLDGPLLIGGDFNMVPWSHALSQISTITGNRRAGPARASFFLGSVPIPIDHVFAPGGGLAEARPRLGGDHRGILARVHIIHAASEESAQ